MNKRLPILVACVVIALAISIWLVQRPAVNGPESALLFDDLSSQANKLNKISIENAQGILLTAEKSGTQWLAKFDAEQATYPIAKEKLAGLVKVLMQARLIEAKTSKEENYKRLGVQSIESIDSLSQLVTLRAGSDSWQVLVGSKAALGEGSYIRLPKHAQSWRLDKTISLPIDKFSWLKQPVLPYQSENIVSVSRLDSSPWEIVKSTKDSQLELAGLPQGRELKYEGILNSVVSGLVDLDFEELVFSDDVSVDNSETTAELEILFDDGETVKAKVSQSDGKHYVKFSTDASDKYWQRWFYQVSSFSAQQLSKSIEDFLAEVESGESNEESGSVTMEEGESPL